MSAAIAAFVIAAFELAISRAGWVIGALLAFLIVTWRHDNDVGAFFPLAVALVMILLILALFLVLMAITL
jgi:hypothetical protein